MKFVDGAAAVEAFYVISGFYMFLILSEKYTSYRVFIVNRLLRLFPVYFAILLLTGAIGAWLAVAGKPQLTPGLGLWLEYGNRLSPGALLYFGLANLTILGQDWVYFLGYDFASQSFYWTSDFSKVTPVLPYFTLVPQAWTLSLEIMFYVAAPFLLRRTG